MAGQVYNPELGFALVGNTANGLKYPYNPFYGEFSPRVALAWAPKASSGVLGNTVFRFGYGRSYGRTNGVARDATVRGDAGVEPGDDSDCLRIATGLARGTLDRGPERTNLCC